MPSGNERLGLLGRRSECDALDRVLASARSGTGQVVVVSGEAGVGKTALLGHVLAQADGFAVGRASGVESEMELAYAGLHQLCGPFLDRMPQLPEPQRLALATAFGARSGEAPDRFLVGLALLSLLAEVAESKPLLCVVDDAQWLDAASLQALSFAARRLGAERIALVFGLRSGVAGSAGADAFDGLPHLALHGLADADAGALLDSALPGPLDARVRNRILAETRGNPLALLELPHGLGAVEPGLAQDAGDDDDLARRIERGFFARMEPLPQATRTLLLLAAAEPLGDVALLWRAAGKLGIGPDAVAPATEAGLLDLDTSVRFRHPLVRSAVYRAARDDDRRRVHAALAEATSAETDPDRRAWHRAASAVGLDDDVATELEESAGRARARGGWAAAAAFLTRATELSSDPGVRAQRALAAAHAKLQAGATGGAHAVLAVAEAGPLSELDSARAQLLGAQIEFAATRGREAPAMLLAAARRLERLDARNARDTYLEAFAAGLFASRLGTSGVVDVAEAVRAATWVGEQRFPVRACELLLDGLSVLVTDGHAAGVALVRDALDAFRVDDIEDDDALRGLWLASRAARALGDDLAWDDLTMRNVRIARKSGALSALAIALTERFQVELLMGHLPEALAVAAEAQAVITATGNDRSPHIPFLLAAWQGREAETLEILAARTAEVTARGEGLWFTGTEWTSAVFFNGLGRYDDALAAAERAAEHPHELGLSTWVYPELIEAAVRTEQPERAGDAMARLTEIAEASGTDWLRGVAVRSRALLSAEEKAEPLYLEAVERLALTRIEVASARAHLLYGEWLRRQGRRVDARGELRAAHEFFTLAGMESYAERARRELSATGETVRARTVSTANDLTAQESLIARLAVEGRTNPEIGAQLFLSPRTVEWHLRKVFTKLGVTSRKGLRTALAGPAQRQLA
ncbi:AAA family ATPase [Lysobacter korlensis]|uniref:AAA family ATPase n=1 Tax=Lysobacter korlensis TaxID=553636 RepID=A0ABV6S093_9GAMM